MDDPAEVDGRKGQPNIDGLVEHALALTFTGGRIDLDDPLAPPIAACRALLFRRMRYGDTPELEAEIEEVLAAHPADRAEIFGKAFDELLTLTDAGLRWSTAELARLDAESQRTE